MLLRIRQGVRSLFPQALLQHVEDLSLILSDSLSSIQLGQSLTSTPGYHDHGDTVRNSAADECV